MREIGGKQVKIIGILVISFLIIKIFSGQIFLADTPRLNQNFFQNLANLPYRLISSSLKTIASIFNKSNISADDINLANRLNKLPLSSLEIVGKGVYAKHEGNVVYIRMTDEAEFDEQIFTAPDGRKYSIRFPKATIR